VIGNFTPLTRIILFSGELKGLNMTVAVRESFWFI